MKYPQADYVCIDEPEIRLAFHDRRSSVRELAGRLKGLLGARAVVVTRGHQGSLALGGDAEVWDVPVFSRQVVDRVGAGDASLSVSAP
jgi:sugar/nucleoside kinase (ribokinase family)